MLAQDEAFVHARKARGKTRSAEVEQDKSKVQCREIGVMKAIRMESHRTPAAPDTPTIPSMRYLRLIESNLMLQPESGRTLIARLAAELSRSAPTTKLTAGLTGEKSQGAGKS